jgi:uncharacterized phage protein (TIGR02218 family)
VRTAKWESGAGALAALLNGTANNQLVIEDLFTITTAGGLTLRYSNRPLPPVAGITYTVGPQISRTRTRMTVGIEVDELQIMLEADSSILVSGTPLMQFIARGGLDNARLVLDRGYAPAPGSAIVGTLEAFSGRISPESVTGLTAKLKVRSDAELLTMAVPRNVYQAGCLNTLYDAACGVNRATFTAGGSATSATDTTRRIFSHALAAAAGTYDLGVVTFTSGPNTGISRTVRTHTGSQLTLMSPVPTAVAPGDSFSIVAGCDKRQTTCTTRFSNLARFRGMPFIPTPESIT